MNYVIMVMKLNKMVLDNKKIEEAAINKCGFISSEFYSGAKWAINEFLKDLWHPASEEPENKDVDIAYLDKSIVR